MRCKKLLSITAFFAAFVFSAAFAGLFIDSSASSLSYSHTHHQSFQHDAVTADAITDFLRQDVRIGNDSFRQMNDINGSLHPPFGEESMSEFADVVEGLADKMQRMNDSNLPRDVRSSWRKHVIAWKDYADFLKHQESLGYSIEELKLRDAQYNVEISRTYYDVLHNSSNYGAFINQ